MRRARGEKCNQESDLCQRIQHSAPTKPDRFDNRSLCFSSDRHNRPPESILAPQASNISRRDVNSDIEPSVSSQPMNVSNSARAVLIPTIQSSVHSLLNVIDLNSSK